MNTISHNRGHELNDHRYAKLIGSQMVMDAGFDMATCEYHNCDLVAKRRIGSREYVLTIEFERTVRNILRNIRRNSRGCCDHQLIVCMGALTVETVGRLLERNLTKQERQNITVIAGGEFTIDVLRALNGSGWVNSGYFQNAPQVNSLGKSVYSETGDVDSGLFQGKCEGSIAKQIKHHGREVISSEYKEYYDC